MRTQTMTCSQLLVALLALGSSGCAPEPELRSSSSAATMLTVAAAQYVGKVDSACTSDATPDVCSVLKMFSQAKAQGATLVVAPETVLGQSTYETDPGVGDNPGQSTSYPATSFIKKFSAHAKQEQIYSVIHLATKSGTKKYSTQVAFGPDGKVVGKHHKFELFAGESSTYAPGDDTDLEVFDTPVGKVGLMICADIYGDLARHSTLVDKKKTRVLAFSTAWTVAGSGNWQAAFAKNWGVYVVGANWDEGSGIYSPEGKPVKQAAGSDNELVVAQIPAP